LRARPGRSCGDTSSLGELDKLNDVGAFTVKDIPAKLKRRRKAPWVGNIKQKLTR